jgi:hypothetical protein
VSVAPHNCDGPLKTMIGVHLCANIPTFLILETFEDYDVPWRGELTPDAPRVKDGYYELPTGRAGESTSMSRRSPRIPRIRAPNWTCSAWAGNRRCAARRIPGCSGRRMTSDEFFLVPV